MSRIGKAPITVPGGVDVTLDGRAVTVKGPRAPSRDDPRCHHRPQDERQLLVERPDDERENRSLHGLTRTLVNNMVVGVTDGFARSSRSSASATAPRPRARPRCAWRSASATRSIVEAPEGVTFEVADADPDRRPGIDKEVVGQVAANIRAIRKPEPYKGKGVRYLGEKRPAQGRQDRQEVSGAIMRTSPSARKPHPPPPPGAQEDPRHRGASASRRVPLQQAPHPAGDRRRRRPHPCVRPRTNEADRARGLGARPSSCHAASASCRRAGQGRRYRQGRVRPWWVPLPRPCRRGRRCGP